MTVPEFLVGLMRIWGAIGAIVVVPFLIWGIDRIDEDARGAYVFRLLLIPGILLIWPIVLWRWWQIEAQDAPWLARYQPAMVHGPLVAVMSAAIILVFALGLAVRQDWPADIAPIQLSETQ
ncbi:MAG: hypothetical protein AAFY31_12880 [Pseudomonadota bacterium]